MPATASAYGLDPVASLSASPNNLAIRQMSIDPANATQIFAGDVAKLLATGFVDKETGTAAATPIGVFTGFEYTNIITKQRLQSNYYPGTAAIVTTDPVWASVFEDPAGLFRVQMKTAVASAAATQALIGKNCQLVQDIPTAAQITSYGRSKVSIGSQGTTATLPVRIIDIVRSPDNIAGTATVPQYVNVLVKFNTHQYLTGLGT